MLNFRTNDKKAATSHLESLINKELKRLNCKKICAIALAEEYECEKKEWAIQSKGILCILKYRKTKKYDICMFKKENESITERKHAIPSSYYRKNYHFHYFKDNQGERIFAFNFADREQADKFFIKMNSAIKKTTFEKDSACFQVEPPKGKYNQVIKDMVANRNELIKKESLHRKYPAQLSQLPVSLQPKQNKQKLETSIYNPPPPLHQTNHIKLSPWNDSPTISSKPQEKLETPTIAANLKPILITPNHPVLPTVSPQPQQIKQKLETPSTTTSNVNPPSPSLHRNNPVQLSPGHDSPKISPNPQKKLETPITTSTLKPVSITPIPSPPPPPLPSNQPISNPNSKTVLDELKENNFKPIRKVHRHNQANEKKRSLVKTYNELEEMIRNVVNERRKFIKDSEDEKSKSKRSSF